MSGDGFVSSLAVNGSIKFDDLTILLLNHPVSLAQNFKENTDMETQRMDPIQDLVNETYALHYHVSTHRSWNPYAFYRSSSYITNLYQIRQTSQE